MRRHSLFLFTVIGFSLLNTKSYAFEFETNPEAQKIRQVQNLSITTSASLSSNLYKTSSSDYILNSDVAVDPVLTLENGVILLGHLSLFKDLRGERKQYFNDAYFGATKTLYRYSAYSVSLLGLGFVPLSEESRKNQHLQTSFMIAPTFGVDMGPFGAPGLRFTIRPSYRQNFHRYKSAMSGNSNNKNTIGLNLTATYQYSSWTFISRNNYNKSQTYRGNTRDTYRFEQAVSYLFHPRASFTFGHVNGGNPLAPNGIDTDVRVFNARTSQLYTSVSYTF